MFSFLCSLLDSIFNTIFRKRKNVIFTMVKPETLLNWQRRFIKNFWSYKHKTPGRRPVTKDIKNLILEMKQKNYLWGCKKIANELKKINIDIHHTTVNRIISTFRKQGICQAANY